MLDIVYYILGKEKGTGQIVVDGTNMNCTDDGSGNITVTVTEGE
jgi:hypothetical protein